MSYVGLSVYTFWRCGVFHVFAELFAVASIDGVVCQGALGADFVGVGGHGTLLFKMPAEAAVL